MNWATSTIGSVCVPTAQRDPRERPDEVFCYVDISSIDRDQKRNLSAVEIIGADAPSRARKEIRAGDVLVSTVRPNLNTVAMVPEELDGHIASTGFCVLRPKEPPILGRFLFYYCCTRSFVNALVAKVRGAQYPAISDSDIKAVDIPLPPLSEQRRIVEILDQADGLRRLRAEADAKAERILPALFIKMFGDPANSWEVHRLGSLLRKNTGALQSGPFGTHLHNSDFVGEGTVLAVGIDNVLDGEFVLGRNRRISNEKYQELEKYTLEAGDVLITIMGTVGRSCVFPGVSSPAICTKHVYRIQVDDRVHPEYLSAALRFSSPLRAQLSASTTGQIVAGTKSADLRNLEMVLPPRRLQGAFAGAKANLDAHRERSRRVAERLEVLFTRLLRDAFSGNLTTSWREDHMKELLEEMEQQARALAKAG